MKKIGKSLCIMAAVLGLMAFTPATQDVSATDFDKCMSVKGCTPEESFNVLLALQKQSAASLVRIDGLCREMNYKGCIGAQRDAFAAWHLNEDHLLALMKKVEAGQLEPSENFAETSLKTK